MKAVILAGGFGTRLSEETDQKPKPMVEVGGMPILWHIMKIYSYYGINDFIICAGYKGYLIKEYFANYFMHTSDVTFDLGSNAMTLHRNRSENWKVTIVDTGLHSLTGGRLKRISHYLDKNTFLFTYGDGLSNVDINESIKWHKKNQKLATITAVQPPGKFGALKIRNSLVSSFKEKPEGDGAWVNGGFFVLEPQILELIDSDSTAWEKHPLESLAGSKQLSCYKHYGFWSPMDTLRDKMTLNQLWEENKAPWKLWK